MTITDLKRISTPELREIRDLCPKHGDATRAVEISHAGGTAKVTAETRRAINAELTRRKATP
jgi:hypothetical protein